MHKGADPKNPPVHTHIRPMTAHDYEKVHALWLTIKGFGIRSVDDSEENIVRFLQRNPHTSMIAEADGEVIGSILCGHDGRTGCFYHVCVREDMRRRGIGLSMVEAAVAALKREHISKISLFAFADNVIGNAFWERCGWTKRDDMNNYEYGLNKENVTTFVTEPAKKEKKSGAPPVPAEG